MHISPILQCIFFNYERYTVVQTSKASQEPKPAIIPQVKEGNSTGIHIHTIIAQIVKLWTFSLPVLSSVPDCAT